jgi:ATP-binding cassette subfamily B protein
MADIVSTSGDGSDQTPHARGLLQIYRRVLDLLGPETRLGYLLAVGNVALVGAQFAEPVLFGKVIDTLAGAQARGGPADWERMLPLLIAWVVFGIFAIVAGTVVGLHADRLSHRRRQAVLTEYFEHVLQLPLAYHGTIHSGRLMKVMLQGSDAMWWLWLGFFREHFATLVSLVVLLPLSIYLNWRMALLLIALCVLFAAMTTFILNKTEELQSSVETQYSDLAERASDALGNVALVQSFTRVEAEVTDLKNQVARLLAAQIPVLSWWAILTVLARAGTTLTILSIILYGTWLNAHGLATIGEIVMFMNFATLVIHRLEQGVSFVNSLFMSAPRIREFLDVMDAEPALRDRPNAIDPGRLTGRIVFDNVSFSYDGRTPAVFDLCFSAEPGQSVALVGATGAGKSTALALLHRAFDPRAGVIRIDGHDIRDFKLAGLRRNIGVVFQESLLFNRSIAENLRVGKPDATEEELREAAGRAQALEFITHEDKGFAAGVGERGRALSGGERQRLSIARALLKDPPILILDEATSAMDAVTEAKFQTAIAAAMKDRTTFIIAHRLATVRNADRILVFDRGRVVETGTFEDLMQKGGKFAELANAQFGPPSIAASEPEALPLDQRRAS